MALFGRLATTLRAGRHAVGMGLACAQRPAVATRFFSTPTPVAKTENAERDESKKIMKAKTENAEREESKKIMKFYARIGRKFAMLGLHQDAVDVKSLEAVIQRSVNYLMDHFGMSKLEAVHVISLHPMLATYTTDVMDLKVAWMRRNGLTTQMISKAIRNHPSWIGRTEAALDGIRDWLLAHGVAPSKIPFVFMVFPQGVSMRLDLLDAKVEYLTSVGIDEEHLRRILNRFPQILTMGLDMIQHKVETLRLWGVPNERIPKLAAVVPEFFCLSMEKVHEKLQVLDRLYGEGKGLEMWMRMPRLVMYNTNQLVRSHEYLTTVVGMKPEQIVSSVTILTRSVDRFIRPRYEYLSSIDEKDLASQLRWIQATKHEFIKLYPDFDPDK